MMHYRRLRLNLSLWAWLPLPPREMSLLHALRSVREQHGAVLDHRRP